jgi:sulfur-oxidizing protein SoxZ
MANSMKIRAKSKDGVADVKVLITHPMEGGGRKDKDGNPIEAHFIQEVLFDLNGKTALTANLSGGVSKNPYLNVKLTANAGDKLKVSWVDNKGETDTAEADVG